MKNILLIAFSLLVMTGCSGLQISGRDMGRAVAQEDRAVVVFSVDNRSPMRFHSIAFARAGNDAGPAEIGTVPVDPRKANVQVFAVSLPAGQNRLGMTRLRAGNLWYEIADPGIVFTVEGGEIHYLGRLLVGSMLVGKFEDSGRKYMHSVKLALGNQLESDSEMIGRHYDLPANASMVHVNLDGGIEDQYLVLQPWNRPGRRWPQDYYDAYGFSNSGPVGPALPSAPQTKN